MVVAFTIFPKGNIDKPVIRESAGDENLDSIAVRAIFDSVPFPPLPQELHRLNLRVSIIFKYVPEKINISLQLLFLIFGFMRGLALSAAGRGS